MKAKKDEPVYVGVGFDNTTNTDADFVRSLVNGGHPIGVLLVSKMPQVGKAGASNSGLQRFGSEKCASGDHAGRWIAVDPSKPCEQPYCKGLAPKVSAQLQVSQGGKQWLWVPYNCYYHVYTEPEMRSCATTRELSWLHIVGDEQQGFIMKQLLGLADPSTVMDTNLPALFYQEVQVKAASEWVASIPVCPVHV